MFNVNTARERIITSDASHKAIRTWFNALQERKELLNAKWVNGRMWRAELRRAQPPYGTLICDGYHALLTMLPNEIKVSGVDQLGWALFASVAVWANADNPDASFAAQLGKEIKGRICVSTLRFDRLQQADSPEVFCQQLIYAVKLRGSNGVNLVSLADSILLWMREWQAQQEHQDIEKDPFARNRVRWACEYSAAHK